MKSVRVNRSGHTLNPDRTRVLIRPFTPESEHRSYRIIARVLTLPEERVRVLLEKILVDFGERHQQIERFLLRRFEQLRHHLLTDQQISSERKLLIGSFFTQEYSLESAALFNPSIVADPNQEELAPGCLRVILSLRATGEGHISSITFRSAIVDPEGSIQVAQPSRYVTQPERIPDPSYQKVLFSRKLRELGLDNEFSRRAMSMLGHTFTFAELMRTVGDLRRQSGVLGAPADGATAQGIKALAEQNYEVRFSPEQRVAERAIFPSSPSQSNGIEDARFVRFENEEGAIVYYATYTAFDGKLVLPQLLETPDFLHFRFVTLNGPAVQNKGMSLFPRKVNGFYAMLSRQDNENIYLMYSDNLHFWYEAQIVARPTYSWEFVQLGNCGSPIETERGWLVLSHGVGPMRRYCIGAFLLDKADPSLVIGRLRTPLIEPSANEREGYVPNVVYTCGALLHGRKLLIPYAMADYATSFATVDIDELLDALE